MEVMYPKVSDSYSTASLRERYQLSREKIQVSTCTASDSLDVNEMMEFCRCFVREFVFSLNWLPMASLFLIARWFDLVQASFCVTAF